MTYSSIGKIFPLHGEWFEVIGLAQGAFICSSLDDGRSWRFTFDEVREALCQPTPLMT